MTVVLPRYIVLKSKNSNNYLKYVADAGNIQGSLQFSGDAIKTSPETKMEVEVAQTGEHTLVHLRSCYSNKYWARKSDAEDWITASAVKNDEDPSSWKCTLFKPEFPDGNYDTVHFKHVQLGLYVYSSSDEPYTNCLFAGETCSSNLTACAVTDWERLIILPRFLAFKGYNGEYLLCSGDKYDSLLYFIGTDISDPKAGFELCTVDEDGSLAIKSRFRNRFLTMRSSIVKATVPPENLSDEGDYVKLQPSKVDKAAITLESKGGGFWICGNCLIYAIPDNKDCTILRVEEYLRSSEIYDVNFRLSDSRIYNQSVQTMDTAVATNDTQQPNDIVLTFTYTDTKTTTWSRTITSRVGFTTTIQAGVPFVADETIQISGSLSGTIQWGETNSTSKQMQIQYTVHVPPMTKVTVEMVGTTGHCDVPFDYIQRDTLPDGDVVISIKNDGLFTGINSYNFQYKATQEPLI